MLYRGIALSVAASDSGGGAGIQADLKTFQALKVFGMNVVVGLTAQNSLSVTGIHDTPQQMIALQFDALFSDFEIPAAKTGMLHCPDTIITVAEHFKKHHVKQIVVDPVMIAQSGSQLISDGAVNTLLNELIPLATLVTPNAPEAATLTGQRVESVAEMKQAALAIAAHGCNAVLIKGGHLTHQQKVCDLLYLDGEFTLFEDEWINTQNTHGTGCTLSAAITAELAAGRDLKQAVHFARRYLRLALQHAFKPGHSHGPLGHAVDVPWL
ncbi:bifunctional hydroxymethylpyrimidine kinase/phosphomethylpyrimidine kinase [Serratia microhaemolytica]|uniref:bifunctional hydroxymethylpyrimidine kinase/phosphomethylpyrimidine kinase n=1 Tax=Serratia microhaemolytica TaxID=2675110 RepID=UPI000FDD4C64|nr:bifunctional hydroxymethylpyrimidine kinase/phosphomethylpyrimidine kinase [Serratia microhaemolytica]